MASKGQITMSLSFAALHVAASNGDKATVRVLVERYGASLKMLDRYNGTPLDDAIRQRHMNVVRYLAPLSSGNHLCKDPDKLIQVPPLPSASFWSHAQLDLQAALQISIPCTALRWCRLRQMMTWTWWRRFSCQGCPRMSSTPRTAPLCTWLLLTRA